MYEHGHMGKNGTKASTVGSDSNSNIMSTNPNKKTRKGCGQFSEYTLLAAPFLLLAGFSWPLMLLAFLEPYAS